MENALFLNNKSNFSSYSCIDNKQSDQWVKDKLKDLYSSNSFYVCEINSKHSKSDLIKNDKNDFPERRNNNESCGNTKDPCCHIKMNTFLRLKDSTKQLLCLLEEIQAKVHTKNIISDETPKFNNVFQCDLQSKEIKSVTNVTDLKRLESHTRKLDTIYITDEHDDCSVYKRLIRKCHCLNHPDYNDFVIHFNEESKFTTSSIGELIKNMRILRKFLYMGGTYTKNALMFLYEGLLESQRYEKLEIIQGCAHADICNVFDEHSIVTTCISWPCKYKYYGNYVTQNLAAGFLYKLADIEQGRRYLNYSSKIANDIRKVLRKKSSCLEIDIVDSLNATLNLLKPNFAKNFPMTCFAKSVYEGIGPRLIKDLFQNRQFMNFDEIYMYLDLLNNYSNFENESEIILHLPALLILFKQLLMEYDNSELNIIVTSILNNIVSKNIVKNDRQPMVTNLAFADTATEAIKMKNEMCQKPPKKNNCKKITKPNKFGSSISQNKQRQPSKQKDLSMSLINRSRKFSKDLRKSIIIVPIEEN